MAGSLFLFQAYEFLSTSSKYLFARPGLVLLLVSLRTVSRHILEERSEDVGMRQGTARETRHVHSICPQGCGPVLLLLDLTSRLGGQPYVT